MASPSRATGRHSGRCLSLSMHWRCRQDSEHGSGLSPRQEPPGALPVRELTESPRLPGERCPEHRPCATEVEPEAQRHSVTRHRRHKAQIVQSNRQCEAGIMWGGVYAVARFLAADLIPNNLSFIRSADETAVLRGEAGRGGERAHRYKRLKKINGKDHFRTRID